MITETNQILSTVHNVEGSKDVNFQAPYKSFNPKHPSCLWARENLNHYIWLLNLNNMLCREYSIRYKRIHKGKSILKELMIHMPNIKSYSFKEPPQCMPEQYKNPSTIQAYRNYYIGEKTFATWKTKVPEWYFDKINKICYNI